MVIQFLKTLIETICRKKKRFGVGNVNRDGHSQRTASVPHRIKTRIIDFDEPAFANVFAQVQSERLQHLEPACARFVSVLDFISLKFAVIRLIGMVPRGFCKSKKTIRMRLLKSLHRFFEPFSRTSGQVDHDLDIFAVHHGQNAFRCCQKFHLFADADAMDGFRANRKVGVNINNRIF